MLKMALKISWKQHVTYEELYGDLPKLSCKIKERSRSLCTAPRRDSLETCSGATFSKKPNKRKKTN